MVKVTLDIDGMACSMCEAHVNDCVRKNFDVKKVSSSHSRGRTEIIAEEAPDGERLRAAIGATGYEVRGISVEPYEKRGLFSRSK